MFFGAVPIGWIFPPSQRSVGKIKTYCNFSLIQQCRLDSDRNLIIYRMAGSLYFHHSIQDFKGTVNYPLPDIFGLLDVADFIYPNRQAILIFEFEANLS
ncbi:MAG: hypothetical protein BWX60_00847 [Candidatus Marinimicrobia bacterium ADurb.Bin030]|nr:MAG: hypothetical protein BWX60_00847 [Candidatus Marinimicrobia bacterium ADurb.Bin030]